MEYTGYWLKYHRLSEENKSEIIIFREVKGEIIRNAVEELRTGFLGLYGRKLRMVTDIGKYQKARTGICLKLESGIPGNSFDYLNTEHYRMDINEGKCVITAGSDAGILYGVFALLRNLQLQSISNYDQFTYSEEHIPSNPLRMLNHWDNLDGSIERGYSGNSFFFRNNRILIGNRTREYARMIASVGINALTINNVNVKEKATYLITDQYYERLRQMSEIFSGYGIKLFLSINFAAPIELGGLNTADPCDNEVSGWWKEKAREIWTALPKFGGFLVKADSEGRPGPFTYGRTHAHGANMLAEAAAPYGGIVIWRCFVYNCRQDWRDQKTDRARAGYDHFMPLDGEFSENVVLQIKNGPMDFQVREPVSPLFGGLKKTNVILEVQIAQEYTGQQRHVCYLMPWFREILQFDTCARREGLTVADIISGKAYHNNNCGMAAVANTGNDPNWTGHDLAAANLYGFGRLAADTRLTAEAIAKEWILMTFGDNRKTRENVLQILMMSWPTYEKYTSPLGIGWMVKPNHHYGPDVDGYEYDRWGTYHRADHRAIGVDRTKEGTGYCLQYPEPLSFVYQDPGTCPEELILFFHRLPYDHLLSTGKTVIQHIYDTHFEGAEEAELFVTLWNELRDQIEETVYQRVLERLLLQKEHSKEWRDVINSYFYRKTGITDQYGRKIYE